LLIILTENINGLFGMKGRLSSGGSNRIRPLEIHGFVFLEDIIPVFACQERTHGVD
jgi:hypothetical protein